MLTLVLTTAVIIAVTLIGSRLSLLVFRANASLIESAFIGLTAISSLLSLIYNFTTVLISVALLVTLATALPFSATRGYRGLLNSLGTTEWTWFMQVLLSGLGMVLIYLWPTASNIRDVSFSGGTLLAHIDLFTHAATINQIALQNEIGNSQILLEGASSPFYHYGLYLLPGLLVSFGDYSALDLLIYVVMPFGIFVLWSLLNEITAMLTKSRGWYVLVISFLALLLADASRAFFYENSLFDLPYLLVASPGAIYGLCIVLLATKAVLQDNKVRMLPLLFCTFLLLGFRALYIPIYLSSSLFVFIALSQIRVTKKIAFAAVVALLATLVGGYLDTRLDQYYEFLLSFAHPASAPGWQISGDNRVLLAIASIGSTFGGPLLLTIGIALVFVVRNRNQVDIRLPVSLLLGMVLGYYVSLQLAITLRNGDITELMQRPFVVVNVICAVVSLSIIYRFFKAKYLILFSGVALPLNILLQSREFGYPEDHSWHQLSYKVKVEKSIVDISSWLAMQAKSGIYVVLPVKVNSYSVYPEAIISALSGYRALFSRLGHYSNERGGDEGNIRSNVQYIDRLTNCSREHYNSRNIFIVTQDEIPCLSLRTVIGSYRVYR